MGLQEETDNDNEEKNSRFIEVIALLFVTIVMAFLFIKTMFY
jgi:hypothetical protein